MSPVLVSHREGPVLVLSNNNVAARNALSFEFYTAVTEALHAAAQDPSVGAIVLTGEGGTFALAAICANWPSGASCLCQSAVCA